MTKLSTQFNSTSALRAGSAFMVASLMVPLAGCGSPAQQNTQPVSAPPPAMGARNPNRPSMDLSTKQKGVLLVGAAALYYYYQKSKKATEKQYGGKAVQYYRSKNGGIYYRDPKTHEAHFVTAPTQTTVQINNPAELAGPDFAGIQQAQGYNGQQTGNGLDYYYKMPAGGTQ